MDELKFINRSSGVVSLDSEKYLHTKDSTSPSGHSILAQIDMTHSGLVTANYGFYLPASMKKGTGTFLKDYNKPVLIGHDEDESTPVDPIGRVVAAEYIDFTSVLRGKDKRLDKLMSFKDATTKINVDFVNYVIENYDGKANYFGSGTIRGTLKISDEQAIQKILDERYLTVSTSFMSGSAVCSVCETDLIKDGACQHSRGKMYDGKLAVIIPGEMRYDHVGIVNAPADPHAHGFKILQMSDKAGSKEIILTVEDKKAEPESPIFVCAMKDNDLYAINEDDDVIKIKDSLNKMEKDMPTDNKIDALLAIKDYFRISLDAYYYDPVNPGESTSITMSKSVEVMNPTTVEDLATNLAKVLQAELDALNSKDSVKINEIIGAGFKKYLDAQHKLVLEGSTEADACFVNAWSSVSTLSLDAKVKVNTYLRKFNKDKIAASELTKNFDAAIPVYKVNDKFKLEETEKTEAAVAKTIYDSINATKHTLSLNEVYDLAVLKAKFNANDAQATMLYPWLKETESPLVAAYAELVGSTFVLASQTPEIIYAEMQKHMENKGPALTEIPVISFAGGDRLFPVIDAESAKAALKVLSRCEAKTSVKDRIFSGIMKRIDKLKIDKATFFDSNSQACDNSVKETVETLLPQFNVIKDKLVALGYQFDTAIAEEVKTDDNYEVEMLEAQIEALTEEVERTGKDNIVLSDSLKDFLTDAIIKEELRKGDYKEEERGTRKVGLLTRTVDSLKDSVKDMMKASPAILIKDLAKVENPVLSPKTSDEKDKEEFDKTKIYAAYNRTMKVNGKAYADKWLANIQKQNNVIITLD